MRKLMLVVFACLFMPSMLMAQDDIANYKGFPVYPPETIEQYAGKETAHIKVLLNSYDFIKESKDYIERAAATMGWIKQEESIEAPLSQVYIKDGDDTRIVKVRFNREMTVEGGREVGMYYDAPQGSVEYTFLTVDTKTTYKIQQIVTNGRGAAVDAYIALLKKQSFEDVAAKFSSADKLEKTINIDPLSTGVMEREIMRLLPGQVSDVFQGEDNKFYLLKLIEVRRADKAVRHAGQNTEDRRPSSVDLTYSSKDTSLAEVMVDRKK